jgi:FkbM family methyltransferase
MSQVVYEGYEFEVRDDTLDEFVLKENFKQQCYAKYVDFKPHYKWLDIGAHIGGFALWASERATSILSVEPELDNFERLCMHIENNSVPNVMPMMGAVVGNDDKFRELYVNPLRNTGTHTLIPKRNRPSRTVTAYNVNELLNAGEINAIKIDAEGAEYEILPAIKDWSPIEAVVLEFHFNVLKDTDKSKWREVIDLLQTHFQRLKYPTDPKGAWTALIGAEKVPLSPL